MTTLTSYSRVEKYRQCPYRYWLAYVKKIREPDSGKADAAGYNALAMGGAVHLGVETHDPEAAVRSYEETTGGHDVKAAIQIRHAVQAILRLPIFNGSHSLEFEREVKTDAFVGYADIIADGRNLYDMKVTAQKNYPRYVYSPQLMIYATELEKQGYTIDYMSWILVPKLIPRRKETPEEYEARFNDEAYYASVMPAARDYQKVADFWADAYRSVTAEEFPATPGPLCPWCGYMEGGYCVGNGKKP